MLSDMLETVSDAANTTNKNRDWLIRAKGRTWTRAKTELASNTTDVTSATG